MNKSCAQVLGFQPGCDSVPSCRTLSGDGEGADVPEPVHLEQVGLEKNAIVPVPPEFPGNAGLGFLKDVPPAIIPGLTLLLGNKVSYFENLVTCV